MNKGQPVISLELLIKRHTVALIAAWSFLAAIACAIECNGMNPKLSGITIVAAVWLTGLGGILYETRKFREFSRHVATQQTSESIHRHSQKMVSMETLAGGVAQDFNNLFAVIGGYSELLALSIQGNDARASYAREITESVKRGSELTLRLLEFCGRSETRKRPDDLNLIVANLCASISPLLRTDITLTFSICKDSLPVLADRGQLQQVLINLLLNARDAVGLGGKIDVGTSFTSITEETVTGGVTISPGSYGVVTVRDNGEGMDEQTVSLIFEPFFTTREIGKGSGMGLSTAFGIVGKHNGQISVESEPGVGSQFDVYLPLFTGEE